LFDQFNLRSFNPMPTEITYPGVFIEEVPTQPKRIEGVETSVAAFAGWTPLGPADKVESVTSWSDFKQKFGGLDSRSLLGFSVQHFFDNGGKKAHIVRVADPDVDTPLQPNTPDFEAALLPADRSGGLYKLDEVDIFNILCVPGETNPSTILGLQRFCRDRRAFLIVDCAESDDFDDVKSGPGNITGDDAMNSAFYFPWVIAEDALNSKVPREFPPCGFVAGLYARTDAARGVWKAAAGTGAGLVGVTGTARDKTITDGQNGILNSKAVNCIRTFPRYGTVVWGARTLRGRDDLGSEWKYVPVRRTALFIEESVVRGLKWVVFEPNDEPLYAKIRMLVGEFLYGMYRQGAFQGLTPNEAYFVKCDRTTTSQSDIDSGIVNVVVGFAPLKPAEFVIIRLQQMTAKSRTENAGNVMTKPFVNKKRLDPYKGFSFRLRPRMRRPVRRDLQLSEYGHARLDEIVEHARRQELLGEAGKLDGTTLFLGPSGTGKTLAAEVIADELGLELYRVDLSKIVSRYIGETEKHLSRVFAAAESAGAVLFFDEADALFGKRTGVSSSHDRYANIEIAYLLSRIEQYNGLAILATNSKSNIDPAFLRRIRYVVDFPAPR
jgi:hypothetical protein